MSKMDDILVMAAEDYEKEMGVDFDTAMKWAKTQPSLTELLRRYDRQIKNSEWHDIIFDKSSPAFYIEKNAKDPLRLAIKYVESYLQVFEKNMKEDGFIYLRSIYYALDLDPLSVSPILGWDKKQNPVFNYIIEPDLENERIIIKVNPVTLH